MKPYWIEDEGLERENGVLSLKKKVFREVYIIQETVRALRGESA